MQTLHTTAIVAAILLGGSDLRATPTLQSDEYDSSCGIEAAQEGGVVRVTWSAGSGQQGETYNNRNAF